MHTTSLLTILCHPGEGDAILYHPGEGVPSYAILGGATKDVTPAKDSTPAKDVTPAKDDTPFLLRTAPLSC